MVVLLERHQELKLDEETRELILSVSPATIDRLLRPYKTSNRRGVSTTKPGVLLKHQIPIRTFADWDETQAGFVEIDLVTHCGDTVSGQYVNSSCCLNRKCYRRGFVTPDGQIRLTLDFDQKVYDQRLSLMPNLKRPLPVEKELVIELKAPPEQAERLSTIMGRFPLLRSRNSKYVKGMMAGPR